MTEGPGSSPLHPLLPLREAQASVLDPLCSLQPFLDSAKFLNFIDLDVKGKIEKLLEENKRAHHHDIGGSKYFLNRILKYRTLKEKINWIELKSRTFFVKKKKKSRTSAHLKTPLKESESQPQTGRDIHSLHS